MKHLFIITAILFFILIIGVSAEAPLLINYQGYLTDDTGDPVDGLVNINFAIYGSLAGSDLLWESGNRKVDVANGFFSVQLGAVTDLPDDLFVGSDSRYLGLSVNSGEEISPRTRFTSSGFALQSLRADTASVVVNSPGVASVFDIGLIEVNWYSTTLLDSIMITVPSSGYVFVTAKATVQFTTGSAPDYMIGNARFQLSDSILQDLTAGSSSYTVVGYDDISLDEEQIHWFNMNTHDLYEVPAAGTYTYYFYGEEVHYLGRTTVQNISLVAQYFPVAYGTVE